MVTVCLGDVAVEYRESCKGDISQYPQVGLEHLDAETVTLSRWDTDAESTFTKKFSKGQVLFGRRRAYLKKAAVAPIDGICSGDITVIEAIPEKILPEYLPFIIQNDRFFDFAVEKSAGSLSPRVKWEQLKKYEFDLPPLEEQKRLADILWAAEELKLAYRFSMTKAESLISAQFREIINESTSVSMVSLDELFDITSGGTPSRSISEYWNNGTIPWVKISDMNGMYISTAEEQITEMALNNSNAKLFKKGTILISIYATLGEVSILNIDAATNQAIAGLVPKRDFNTEYVYYSLRNLKDKINEIGRGSTQKNINLSILKQLTIPIPSEEEQAYFSEVVKKSDEVKEQLSQALNNLSCIMKKILNG